MLSVNASRVTAFEPQLQCITNLKRIQDPRLTVEPYALGASAGIAHLMISTAPTISSMSEEWIAQARESGRFGEHTWNERVTVRVVTLDDMIDKFGPPVFCKIDVEGFEPQVVAGLSQPLAALSFEFAPEWPQNSRAVVDRLAALGFDGFNISLGESHRFEWDGWCGRPEVLRVLASFHADGVLFGDVYARTSSLASS